MGANDESPTAAIWKQIEALGGDPHFPDLDAGRYGKDGKFIPNDNAAALWRLREEYIAAIKGVPCAGWEGPSPDIPLHTSADLLVLLDRQMHEGTEDSPEWCQAVSATLRNVDRLLTKWGVGFAERPEIRREYSNLHDLWRAYGELKEFLSRNQEPSQETVKTAKKSPAERFSVDLESNVVLLDGTPCHVDTAQQAAYVADLLKHFGIFRTTAEMGKDNAEHLDGVRHGDMIAKLDRRIALFIESKRGHGARFRIP